MRPVFFTLIGAVLTISTALQLHAPAQDYEVLALEDPAPAPAGGTLGTFNGFTG